MYIVYKTKKKFKKNQVKYIDHFEIVGTPEEAISRYEKFLKQKLTYTCGWAKLKDSSDQF